MKKYHKNIKRYHKNIKKCHKHIKKYPKIELVYQLLSSVLCRYGRSWWTRRSGKNGDKALVSNTPVSNRAVPWSYVVSGLAEIRPASTPAGCCSLSLPNYSCRECMACHLAISPCCHVVISPTHHISKPFKEVQLEADCGDNAPSVYECWLSNAAFQPQKYICFNFCAIHISILDIGWIGPEVKEVRG